MLKVTRLFCTVWAVAWVLAFSAQSSAQDFPSKSVRVVVSFPPGGAADVRARYYALKLSESLGQSVVVDNKPGASGAIGAESVAKSPADGYTLLYGSLNELSVVPAMGMPHGYNAQKDFAAISLGSAGYPVIVVAPGVGVNSVSELIALSRAKPGKLNFATAGANTHQHVLAGYFVKRQDVDMLLVPYKGGAPAMLDVVSGQVQMAIGYAVEFTQYAKAGRVKPLAVLGPRRIPALNDVPTMAEAGYPGYEVYGWAGFFAPVGTAPEIVQRLNTEIVKIGAGAEMRKILAELGGEFISMTPAEFARFHRTDMEKWVEFVKVSGAKFE